MNYSNLFNTLHSEVISEEVKEDIVSKVLDKVVLTNEDLLEESINEAESKVAPYVEALSLLVNSDITNESLEEAIDEIFSNETQEVIDSVTEAFQEDVVRGILIEQLLEEKGLSESSPAPIGLAGLRRAAGEEPIQRKAESQPQPKQPTQQKANTQQPKQPTQQTAKQESSKSQPKQASKEHLYVMKGSDGSYRGARTKEMKDTVLKARKEAQKKVKTEAPQPKEVNKTADRIKSNKIRTTAKLSSTGFREAIPVGQKKETDEEKIKRLGGNPGAQAAVRNRRTKSNEVEGQQHLDLSSGTNSTDNSSNDEGNANSATQNAAQPPKKPRALSLKQFDKLSPEEQKKQKQNLSKNAQKQLTQRENDKKPAEEKNTKGQSTKNTSTVYLKGGEEPSTKKKPANYDASAIDQEIYAARKDALEAKGTPEYAALKQKWEDLKAKKAAMANESLSESLVTLFSSNISEATLRSIFEMVAACKKNAEKALKRREAKFNSALDVLNKDLEANKVVNPELAKKAEQEGAKKEALEQRIKKKFNKEI